MKTMVRIDKAGRLVVPRRLREAIGLDENTELEIEQEGNTLVLRHRSEAGTRAVKENGIWVFESDGGVITNQMVNEVIERGRNERLQRVLGK
ncbi:MAG: AbrB/MazE/SpoVT family DNA-binding domain-containing protein [Acidobacteriaceae bacterium]